MILVNMHLAFASLRSSKIRSLLTMVAVIIGVASFITVTATVDGLRSSVVTEINDLGGNLINVSSGDLKEVDEDGNVTIDFADQFVSGPQITQQDLETVEATEGTVGVAPARIISNVDIVRGEGRPANAFIYATNDRYPETYNRTLAEGQFISDDINGRFVVIGNGVAEQLYAGDVAVGSRLMIGDEAYTIIGIMEEAESTLGDLSSFNENNAVFMTTANAQKILGEDRPLLYNDIAVQLDENTDPSEYAAALQILIDENHNGQREVTVLTQDELLELVDSLLAVIKLAGQFLSYIMLFVASIVILLIMLIAVRERTREIGIRKSIGATNNNILVQFMTEAVVISWVGSAIGLVFGVVSGFALQRFADITPGYSVNTIVTLIVISTFVGVIAGVIPAWMAARRDPVESLRHE